MFTSTILITLALSSFVYAQTYQQVWSDEFNGNSLDLSKWQYEVNCDGGGNNELQCYTSSSNNLKVANGALSITAIPQAINGKQYSSARINTRASAAWRYGKIEFRAKIPSGQYLWPALWMMPRDNVYGMWAASGEIDIMENRGNTNQQESTLHYGGGWPNNVYQGSGPVYMSFNMTSDFHLYAAVWTPEKIDFLVDDRVYYTQTLQKSFWSGVGTNPYTANGQPFDQYFYIIINLAIGGNFFGGNANSLTVQQAQQWANPTLSVDYVRVYQLTTSPVVNPAPAPQPQPTTSSSTSSSTPAATTPAQPCPAGMCGSAGCCNDQRSGIQCYDRNMYSCPVDGFSGKFGLCTKGSGVCQGACFNPTQYQCNPGGWLEPYNGAVATPATSSTTRAATSTTTTQTLAAMSSTTRAVTSTTTSQTPAATQSSSACKSGCGSGVCCNDARMGGVCFSLSVHTCPQDNNGNNYLCGPNAGACNGNCFDAVYYKCVNGQITQK